MTTVDLASMRPGVKLAGFALVLALALAGGAVVGAAVPEQRTGGSGTRHDAGHDPGDDRTRRSDDGPRHEGHG